MEQSVDAHTLREMVRRRPGMFFGTSDKDAHALAPLLGRWTLDLLASGASEVALAFRANGNVELSHTGGRAIGHGDNVALACSSMQHAASSTDGAKVAFVPDVEAFPMLAVRGTHLLVGMLRDAATAFPSATLSFVDEISNTEIRLRHSRGCADRLSEEVASRWMLSVLRSTGATGDVTLDVAFAWCGGPGLQLVALTNGQRNANGGSHVLGVWQGIAAALGTLGVRCKPEQLPRNAALVVSVHVESPDYGPVTKDCLHDRRSREAVRDAVARDFPSQLIEAAQGSMPPWQLAGGVHRESRPWLTHATDDLAGNAEPDPYAHHENHGDLSASEEG
jgi:DNA gyrase/topoisomerase IV subunit B